MTLYDRLRGCCGNRLRGITFVELMKAAGPEAAGEYAIYNDRFPNIIWWCGVSQQFVDAFNLLRPDLEIHSCSPLAYHIDGCVLNMPLANSARQYKEPHWLPLYFNFKSRPEPQS